MIEELQKYDGEMELFFYHYGLEKEIIIIEDGIKLSESKLLIGFNNKD